MQKVASVLRRIDDGQRASLVKDAQGRDRLELRRFWSPLKTVVSLSDYELSLVEVALATRSRR